MTEIFPNREPPKPRFGRLEFEIWIRSLADVTEAERVEIISETEKFFAKGGDVCHVYEGAELVMTIRRGDKIEFRSGDRAA